SSSFAAFKLSGGGLASRLADDSANAPFTAAALTADSLTLSVTPLSRANGGTGTGSATTDGQLLVGNTATGNWSVATLTGTSNEVTVTNGNGSVTLSTPQAIGTGNSPTFANLTLTSLLKW